MKLSFKKWLEATKIKYTKDQKRRLKKSSSGKGPEWSGGIRIYTERK
jgi:hypothetical protein